MKGKDRIPIIAVAFAGMAGIGWVVYLVASSIYDDGLASPQQAAVVTAPVAQKAPVAVATPRLQNAPHDPYRITDRSISEPISAEDAEAIFRKVEDSKQPPPEIEADDEPITESPSDTRRERARQRVLPDESRITDPEPDTIPATVIEAPETRHPNFPESGHPVTNEEITRIFVWEAPYDGKPEYLENGETLITSGREVCVSVFNPTYGWAHNKYFSSASKMLNTGPNHYYLQLRPNKKFKGVTFFNRPLNYDRVLLIPKEYRQFGIELCGVQEVPTPNTN